MKINKLWIQIISGISALGLCVGVVFGLASSNKNKVSYVDLNNPKNKSVLYDKDTPKQSKWQGGGNAQDLDDHLNPKTINSFATNLPHPNDYDPNSTGVQKRFDYASVIIDGHDHTEQDQSFNQSAYQAEVQWAYASYGTPPAGTDGWYPEMDKDLRKLGPASNLPTINGDKYSGRSAKPTKDTTDGFTQTYNETIKSGVKSLILPGFLHETPLESFRSQSKEVFDGAGYILIDQDFAKEDNHVASVMFRSDQSAFLTGLATAQYLNENFAEYYKPNKPLAVGTYGGMAIPTVTIFMGGLEWGIQVFNNFLSDPHYDYKNYRGYAEEMIAKSESNPKIGWTSTDADPTPENIAKHSVKFINLGAQDSWFSGTFSMGDGRSCTQTLLSYGADAIMAVAGPQTMDTLAEIANQKSNCIVIGVDTPQELTGDNLRKTSVYTDTSAADGGDMANRIIKFSATKNISTITEQILSLAYGGKQFYYSDNGELNPYQYPSDGSAPTELDALVGTYGYLTVGNYQNNGIRSSKAADRYLKDFVNFMFKQSTTDYDSVMTFLKETEVPWSGDGHQKLFNYLDEHMMWVY